jgi:hypothetical protein
MPLASGAINSSGDMIEIGLVQPADNPSVIMIRWPDAPTITPPAATTRLLVQRCGRSLASTALARIKASRQL